MSDENGVRTAAWKDNLSDTELDVVERLERMPPDMRPGFVYVMLKREIDRVREPLWRTGLSRVGYVIGGLLAGLVGQNLKG